jgi:hypothetical protein
VDLPLKNGGSFHSYVKLPEGKPPFSYGFPMVFPLKPPFSYGFLHGTTVSHLRMWRVRHGAPVIVQNFSSP